MTVFNSSRRRERKHGFTLDLLRAVFCDVLRYMFIDWLVMIHALRARLHTMLR